MVRERVEDHIDLIARDAAGKDHVGASFPVAAVSIHVVDDGICSCCLAQLGETLSIHKFVGIGDGGGRHLIFLKTEVGRRQRWREISSEESRVGKECVSTSRARWSQYHLTKT